MPSSAASRCDRIIALIDQCLADIDGDERHETDSLSQDDEA
jgi:hypothetical protein